MATRGWLRGLLSLAVGLAFACATTPAPEPAVETGQLFLWSVERADGTGGVAHLFGTVHLSQAALHFDPAVERALAEAETLVLEVDPSELQSAATQQTALRMGTFEDGRSLDQVIGAESWDLLSQRATALGLEADGFRAFEPWFALLQLQAYSLAQQGFEPERGAEVGLAGQAIELSMPTIGLETVEDQFGAFDTLPLALQTQLLRGYLMGNESAEPATSDNGLPLLLDAWSKGDVDRVEAEVFEGLARDPGLEPFYENIYFRRNREMALQIAGFLDTGGSWFVAVGAAHMVGAEGIPRLLTEYGYRVERIAKTVR